MAFGEGSNIPHERLRQPNTPFRRYITDTTITDIQFSRYGRKEAIVQDMQTKDPRLFAESGKMSSLTTLRRALADVEPSRS